MIAETGLAALWLAAGLAALQFVLMIVALRTNVEAGRTIRSIAVVQGALTVIAFAALLLVFARSDMSVALVFENSHTAKPFIYKVAGAWGNHEGSMLMWVTILSVAGALFALLSRRTSERTLVAALGAQAALALGFYAFLLIASNPFARLFPAPPRGGVSIRLLQDPGLAFHPPTLYVGYVGLSVAFSLAVGALLTGEVDSRLARAMRPWVLGAWIFLTLGITAGSYWAYYELGWGGYWFWDPVENASLMPWLAATALLHSINVLAARGALKAWTMMLAVIAFSMSMVGTFLVRSGILTSVHAFAIDPERGTFLLALLAIYVGAAFTLFALRGATLKEGAPFELVSRETGLVINNLLLSVILGIVFLGTLYPLFVEAVSGEKLSVGAPYFNSVAGPLALVLAALVGVGPLLKWRRETRPVLKKLTVPALLGVTALVITFIVAPDMGILPRLGADYRRLSRVREHPAAHRAQPAASAACDLGHGVRAFRDRGCADRNGDERGLHQRAAGGDQDGRDAERWAVDRRASWRCTDGGQELDGDRGRAARHARRGCRDPQSADALLQQPANGDQ